MEEPREDLEDPLRFPTPDVMQDLGTPEADIVPSSLFSTPKKSKRVVMEEPREDWEDPPCFATPDANQDLGTPEADIVPNSPSSLFSRPKKSKRVVMEEPREDWEDPPCFATPDANQDLGTPEADIVPNSPSSLFSTPKKRKRAPYIGSEDTVGVTRRRSVIGINDSYSDSDDENDNDLELPSSRILDIRTDDDLTPKQMDILRAEDKANDSALRDIVPEDCFTFNWTRDQATFAAKRETFTGTPGPTFEITDSTTPTDVFDRMFDVDFIDSLCTETNRYARQRLEMNKNKLSPSARLNKWKPTDRHEMIAFLSILILQGLYPLRDEESYFSFNGFGTMPYFSQIMSYNRFLLLKSNLHFVDNNRKTANDSKLFKIQPVIDYFNDKFSRLFYPHQEIAIDESLLKWHGHLSFTQKINTKAAKVGIKTYELCDSSTGYLWRFRVYVGKDKPTATNDNDGNVDNDNVVNTTTTKPGTSTGPTLTPEFRPTNATAKIVFDLIEPLLHRGHTVIMDNFYNCPLLARCLKRKQTDCYGTQRLNREFIPLSIRTMTKNDLRHGELVASYCSDLSLIVWRDANLVSMISTYHKIEIGAQNKNNRTTYKPSLVIDYNKHMGGVDRKDQFLSAQPLERMKSKVWYKKLFRRLFSVAIFNCYVLYHTKHPKVSHRLFRTKLAEKLLTIYRNIDLTTEYRLIKYHRPDPVPKMTTIATTTMTNTTITTTTITTTTTMSRPITVSFTVSEVIPTPNSKLTLESSKLTLGNRPIVEGNHFPVRAAILRGRCWWCWNGKKKTLKRTVYKCIECDVFLCVDSCFKDFHKP